MDGDQLNYWRNASKSFPLPCHHSLLQHKQVAFGCFGIYTGVIKKLKKKSSSSCTFDSSQLQFYNHNKCFYLYKSRLVLADHDCTWSMTDWQLKFTYSSLHVFWIVYGNPTFRSLLSLCSCTFPLIKGINISSHETVSSTHNIYITHKLYHIFKKANYFTKIIKYTVSMRDTFLFPFINLKVSVIYKRKKKLIFI